MPRILLPAALGAAVALALALFPNAPYANAGDNFYQDGATGSDVSFPQCGTSLPSGSYFAVVGVTNGSAWSANPCLATLYQWAAARTGAPSFYVNTGNPGPISTHWGATGPHTCADPSSYADTGCAYNYGWAAAHDAYTIATNATSASAVRNAFWWLDVETANSWNGTFAANTEALNGWLDYLAIRAVAGVGVYSTGYQWGVITGGATGNVPNWVAGATNAASAITKCGQPFTGGPVYLTQYVTTFDIDYACARPTASGAVANQTPGVLVPGKQRSRATPTATPKTDSTRKKPTATPPPTATPRRGDPIRPR